ncbi:hypothetical protein J3Q64DRAFT_1712224 [Phycomyces blakesleeanus]|uniref:Uncharacterized protein n=1 Tax=Phycomyces blakesleeanus TaxID=4837 RepID=A0ABR3BFB8_PHYBL
MAQNNTVTIHSPFLSLSLFISIFIYICLYLYEYDYEYSRTVYLHYTLCTHVSLFLNMYFFLFWLSCEFYFYLPFGRVNKLLEYNIYIIYIYKYLIVCLNQLAKNI